MKSAFVFPIYLATNKIQKQIQREGITEDTRTFQERPAVNRPRERQTNFLQISKCLCIIIRSCNKYKC